MIVIKILISSLFLVCSFPAFALKCIPIYGPIDEIEDIGSVAVSNNVPVGTRLWTSSEKIREVQCSEGEGEYVYFYGNPDKAPVRPGIAMGIIYNGRDLGLVESGNKIQTDIYVPSYKIVDGKVRFQVYLQKTGKIGSPTPYPSIAVFQLDGKGGINATPNSNYRYSTGGINNIRAVNCNIEISMPSEVDFGNVYWVDTGKIVAVRDFIIRAEKTSGCEGKDSVGVNIMFDPQSGMVTNNQLDFQNGSALRIFNNGKQVELRKPTLFWKNTSSGFSHEEAFRAEIFSIGAPVPGAYTKTIITHVNYF